MTASRLYRQLSAAPKPLFRVVTSGDTFTDRELTSLTSHHGGSRVEGYNPATLRFTTVGLTQTGFDSGMSLELSPAFADWIRDRTGQDPNRQRFVGHKGSGQVDDRGDRGIYTTTITASSWATMLRTAGRNSNAPVGNSLVSVLNAAFQHPVLGSRIPVAAGSISAYDSVRTGDANQSFDRIVGDWAEDRGIVCLQRMDGSVEIRPLSYYASQLTSMAATSPPLLRSQTLSPTKWAQPLDSRASELYIRRRNAAGTADENQKWSTPAGAVDLRLETRIEDWTNTNIRTDNYIYAMNALTFSLNYARVGIDEVRVNIGHLLSSPKEYDREVAGALLRLNTTRPIFLGADWHAAIRGPMVVTEIDERITPDGWIMTLSLDTPRRQFGMLDSDLPRIPPRIWKHYTDELWRDETRIWKDA